METTQTELKQHLQTLGLCPGDTVMVHASLRAVGPVEGRAEGLVEALLSVLGEQGTLMVYVDYEPTDAVPYFDPHQSPACPEYGVLAEVIRSWPGAVRSLNPGASVAAIGYLAPWLCSEHPLNYGYGENTPFAKLVAEGGKVLLLGSDPDQVTLLHYAEHCARLPGKRVIRRTYQVQAAGGAREVEIEEFDTSLPVLASMPEDYFARITRAYVAEGKAQRGRVGQANAVSLPAADFVRFAIDKMEREYGH